MTAARKLMSIEAWRTAIRTDPATDAILLKEYAGGPDTSGQNIVFVMSTGHVDRVNDQIALDGWDLDSYRKNPVWLWAHDRTTLPIARSVREWIENDQLKSELVFADFEFAQAVEKSIRGGFLNACSVGFRPLEWSFNDDRGLGATDFRKQELLECSVVPVPCNPEALVAAKSAGIDTSPFRQWAEQLLGTPAGVFSKEFLEQMARAAGPQRVVSLPAPPPNKDDAMNGASAAHAAERENPMSAAVTKEEMETVVRGVIDPLRSELTGMRNEFDKLKKLKIGAGMPVASETLDQIREAHVAGNNGGAGLKMGKFVRAFVLGHRHNISAAAAAERYLKDPDFAHEITKSLGESTVAGGGGLVPTMYAADLIEYLRPNAIVRKSGPIVIPLPSGNLTIPKQTSASTATYEGENVAVTPSDQAFGQARLSAKKLAALTVISNDLIRDSNPAVDVLVRNDLGLQVANREDLAFIRGQGTNYEPLGVLNAVNPANVIPASGSNPALAAVTTYLMQLQGALEDNNVPLNNCVFWMAPRSKRYLMTLRDGVGQYVFADEMRNGTLMGFKYFCSTQIPTNQGEGSDASEIYFGSMDQFMLGDNLEMDLTIVPNGAWDNGSGTITSGLSNDQTVVRVIAKHDALLRHDYGFAVLTGVIWIA